MHNNYYFLRQLSRALQNLLAGSVISECFSQSKGELVLRFETHEGSRFVRISTLATLSAISFPENFQRAKKNSVDLFPDVIGRRVISVRQFLNERSFALELQDNYTILFKMHGNRSNVLLFHQEQIIQLFRSAIVADNQIRLSELDREIDWSLDAFRATEDNLAKLYFTFGKAVWNQLAKNDFQEKSSIEKYEMIVALRDYLEHPSFYLSTDERSVVLTLFQSQNETPIENPLEAANEFFYRYNQTEALRIEKQKLRSSLQARISGAWNYIEKNQQKLSELGDNNNYKQWADLIMANMHIIPAGAEKVILNNFYKENTPLEIKLKRELSPQKNAEAYYRKSKNQQIEVDRLTSTIKSKRQELEKLNQTLTALEQMNDLKQLKKVNASVPATQKSAQKDFASTPFHEFEFMGFRIWVGKNATSNDELTFRHSYKEDLWLHAKDVTGSHVLIKHMAGRKFPKEVIERAAELAAYNSKRKTETLCPVIVTPKKFVRKRKGDPAGAVVVEREDTIMVVPKL